MAEFISNSAILTLAHAAATLADAPQGQATVPQMAEFGVKTAIGDQNATPLALGFC